MTVTYLWSTQAEYWSFFGLAYVFSRSWQQEKWSHGNSFHPDTSLVNPNIRPFISPSSSWHGSELALARVRTLEVTWETGSAHVLSDSESGAAGISWHKLASKHSFMRFTTEANRSNIYWGPCSNWRERRVWWKPPPAVWCACVVLAQPRSPQTILLLFIWTIALWRLHTLPEPAVTCCNLLNKIHFYSSGQAFKVSCALGCVGTCFCASHSYLELKWLSLDNITFLAFFGEAGHGFWILDSSERTTS